MSRVYDETAMAAAIELLTLRPQTIPQLAKLFNRSKRSIRRWLVEMSERGHRVVRDGPGLSAPYMIVKDRKSLAQ